MSNFDIYDQKDPDFIKDLRESRDAVMVAAEWLNKKGFPVVIKPTFERPKSSDMAEFADDGDLEIMQRIEVKRRKSLTFTSKEDFPYDTLIIDANKSFLHDKNYFEKIYERVHRILECSNSI